MSIVNDSTHYQKIDPGTWYDDHPHNPETGSMPLLEVIIWQLPDNRGLIRTYNFNHSCVREHEQSRQMGLLVHDIFHLLVKGMAKIGILKKMTDEEIAQEKDIKFGRRLH